MPQGPLGAPRPFGIGPLVKNQTGVAEQVIDETLRLLEEAQDISRFEWETNDYGEDVFVPALTKGTTVIVSQKLVNKADRQGGKWVDAVVAATAHEAGHVISNDILTEPFDLTEQKSAAELQRLVDAGYLNIAEIRGPEDQIPTEPMEVVELIKARDVEQELEQGGPFEEGGPTDIVGHTMGDSLSKHMTGLEREEIDAMLEELAKETDVI